MQVLQSVLKTHFISHEPRYFVLLDDLRFLISFEVYLFIYNLVALLYKYFVLLINIVNEYGVFLSQHYFTNGCNTQTAQHLNWSLEYKV